MKTNDLINALVADMPASHVRLPRRLALSLAAGAAISAVLFLSTMGLRPDIAVAVSSPRFLFKFVVTLALGASAAGLLYRLARPAVPAGLWAVAVLLAPALLAAGVSAELFIAPRETWLPGLVGTNAVWCLLLIPLLAIAPLALLMLALRDGAPTRPGLTGAVAGLVCGGVAAAIYAAHCTDDSPLFVATWYSLATAIVALAGYVAGRRVLRW